MIQSLKTNIRQGILRLLPGQLGWKLLDRYYQMRLSDKGYEGFRHTWYREGFDGGVVRLSHGKYHLYPDEIISRYFFVHQHFNAEVRDLLLAVASECRSFIDIGANIGLISVPFAQAATLPVLAIEPVQQNYDMLIENIWLNRVESRIETLQVALGEVVGEAEIHLSERNSGDHRLTLHSGEHRPTQKVQVDTLDRCLAQYPHLKPPFLIKIDVQGHELMVLRGATQTLAKPVFIVAEIWPVGLQESNASINMFNDFCISHGLQLYRSQAGPDGGTRQLVKITHLNDILDDVPDSWGGHLDIVVTNMPIEPVMGWLC